MSRWEPNARGRLERAAMELYGERGFDATTVAEIAERAGLTERTFFRHFADKREVLFGGSGALRELLVGQVGEAPLSWSPMETIVAVLVEAAKGFFDERQAFARARQAIIGANVDLEERELAKMADLTSALADALRRRDVTEPAATLAAEAGMAVFRVAFERWTAGPGDEPLSQVIEECADELRSVTADRLTSRSR